MITSFLDEIMIKVTVADRVQDFKDAAIKTFKFWSGTIPQVNDELVMDKIESQKDSLYISYFYTPTNKRLICLCLHRNDFFPKRK